jgi:hypothetical protein
MRSLQILVPIVGIVYAGNPFSFDGPPACKASSGVAIGTMVACTAISFIPIIGWFAGPACDVGAAVVGGALGAACAVQQEQEQEQKAADEKAKADAEALKHDQELDAQALLDADIEFAFDQEQDAKLDAQALKDADVQEKFDIAKDAAMDAQALKDADTVVAYEAELERTAELQAERDADMQVEFDEVKFFANLGDVPEDPFAVTTHTIPHHTEKAIVSYDARKQFNGTLPPIATRFPNGTLVDLPGHVVLPAPGASTIPHAQLMKRDENSAAPKMENQTLPKMVNQTSFYWKGVGMVHATTSIIVNIGTATNNSHACKVPRVQKCVKDTNMFLTCGVDYKWTIAQSCGIGYNCAPHETALGRIMCEAAK